MGECAEKERMTMAEKIFYKYLGLHGIKTLCEGRFLISSPTKYWSLERDRRELSDPNECKPQLSGSFSQETVDKLFPGVDAAGYSKFLIANFNKVFAAPDTLDGFLRILCLCDPEQKSDTDAHMWKTYAKNFRGLRLGIKIDVSDDLTALTRDYYGQYVRYCNASNLLDATAILDMRKLGDMAFDVVFKKRKKYDIESEYRLLMVLDEQGKFSQNVVRDGERDFWNFPKDSIVSFDLGCDMPVDVRSRLIRCYKEQYFSVHRITMAAFRDGRVVYEQINV